MSDHLRGAIVGVGHVAVAGHAPGWARRADVEIVAACDLRPERRRALAAFFPNLAWHESLESLLTVERPDFVDICTPPASHAPAIADALEAGAHVLCEKPLVLDPGELESLGRLAEKCGRALSAVHNWRYAPMLARATEVVRSGALGLVRRCRWEVLRDRPSVAITRGDVENWRLDPALSGGGILTDHGWHAIYLLSDWMGTPQLTRARLTSNGEPDPAAEDTAEVELRFSSGVAEIFLTWRARERRNRVEIRGERGTLTIDGRTLEIRQDGHPTQVADFPEALSEGSHHPDWFAGVAAAFLEEVRDPGKRGRTLAEAAICLSMIQRARKVSEKPEAGPSRRSGIAGIA